tara:strand:- start:2578 stop:4386 length:1809 start_codon:yes stop_codon:yes gene_type:complete
MKSSCFLFFLLVGFVLPSFSNGADLPNVIIVITDDQGYGDLSCHGNPVVKTPFIDALAGESVRLDDYHVAPTCSPTRGALVTGHWTDRTGVWHTIMGRSMIRENEVTIGQIFKDNGYATGMFGKWHMGDNYPFRPEDRGFTEVLRHGGGGVGQTPDYWDNAYFDGSYFHNKKPVPAKGFCTDVFFQYAKDFISAQVQADKPFLTYLCTNAPHGPMHAPVESSAPYAEHGESVANFFGMVANIDDNVGAMREFLEEKGIADNTIFIFTTDNGTAGGRSTFDGGMRGAKGSEYDGGHRVPFFLHWPNGGFDKEHRIETITAHVDVVPTLIDLCGINPPEGVIFDGTSIRALLESSDRPSDWPDRILVTDSQRVKDPIKWRKSAVMTNDWRLVSDAGSDGPRHELYAIKSDPKQEKDVIADHPEVAERLKEFYHNWWVEIEPSFGDPARIRIGNPAENPSRLTCHDWITTGSSPWNQAHIRNGDDKPGNLGFWYLEIEKSGDYEIELRRWPNEGPVSKRAITDAIPAGSQVPGGKAYRATDGRAIPAKTAQIEIGGQNMKTEIPAGASSVTFDIKLEAGPSQLSATFVGPEGQVTGAYYAYVKRK